MSETIANITNLTLVLALEDAAGSSLNYSTEIPYKQGGFEIIWQFYSSNFKDPVFFCVIGPISGVCCLIATCAAFLRKRCIAGLALFIAIFIWMWPILIVLLSISCVVASIFSFLTDIRKEEIKARLGLNRNSS